MTYWQKIFLLSVVNGADNAQDMLPSSGWQFPRSTWFQQRLDKLRNERKENDDDEA
jgi:hypothetical protein